VLPKSDVGLAVGAAHLEVAATGRDHQHGSMRRAHYALSAPRVSYVRSPLRQAG
jgi:hypothetical protein